MEAEVLGVWNWDVFIVHFLGVDHVGASSVWPSCGRRRCRRAARAGHRYQASHAAMREKQLQIDSALAKLFGAIDRSPFANDTYVFVLGDHGMTPDGNHGA
jgi:predicted AlkP superfamily pyrophosphatase or phosphodiesterase